MKQTAVFNQSSEEKMQYIGQISSRTGKVSLTENQLTCQSLQSKLASVKVVDMSDSSDEMIINETIDAKPFNINSNSGKPNTTTTS